MAPGAQTLAEKTADHILSMIQGGRYQPGHKLPTEKELCSLTGAGRNTVREALKILASRNVLIIRHGAGSYVSDKQGVSDDPFGFAMVNDIEKLTRDLIQIRIILEPPIAALAAQCATDRDIRELAAILDKMEHIMEKRGGFAEADVAFHVKIAECTHNTVMQNLVPVISKGVTVFARAVSETEYRQTMLSHRRIWEHISRRRSFEAEQEMRYHLLFNRNRYLYRD